MSDTSPQFSEVWAVFCGSIDQANAQKISNFVSNALQSHTRHIHLLLHSAGGYVNDGVFLYHLFRSLPIELTAYNAGQVSSAAVFAYLGAQHRKTSMEGMFMLHLAANTGATLTTTTAPAVARSLAIDDERTQTILRRHLKLSDDKWVEIHQHALFITGEEAIEYGLAEKIGNFAPPRDALVFNIIGA